MTHVWLAADTCPAAVETGGLTQPSATVIAAVIAIVGAVVAFLGVTITTRTTRKENRRSEKVRVISDAWTAAVKYSRALERVNKIEEPVSRATKIGEMAAGPMLELSDEYVVAVTRLPIYNFGVAYAALYKLHGALTGVWDALRTNPTSKADEDRATKLYQEAQAAIKQAVEDLD